jgi:hypothetical protein
VDGSPHHVDSVQKGFKAKRNKLRSMGFQITIIANDDFDAGLMNLEKMIDFLNFSIRIYGNTYLWNGK